MLDYTYFYRCELPIDGNWPTWDLFISAFNDSERVRNVFNKATANEKYWIIHPQYGYQYEDLNLPGAFHHPSTNEGDFILKFWENDISSHEINDKNICIDATGFLRPHLMFLLKVLQWKGLRKIDILYSEPKQYKKKDLTTFSDPDVVEVRQVVGFEGNTDSSHSSRDILIIGAGYETHLIAEVAEDKDQAKKILLFGLPSLRADMYQQSAWRTWEARDSLGGAMGEKNFAPASDPFATAAVLSEIVRREKNSGSIGHLYLSPLATKAQAVGFAFFFLTECRDSNTSIIFPFCQKYDRETSIGLSRVWLHTLEFIDFSAN